MKESQSPPLPEPEDFEGLEIENPSYAVFRNHQEKLLGIIKRFRKG